MPLEQFFYPLLSFKVLDVLECFDEKFVISGGKEVLRLLREPVQKGGSSYAMPFRDIINVPLPLQ